MYTYVHTCITTTIWIVVIFRILMYCTMHTLFARYVKGIHMPPNTEKAVNKLFQHTYCTLSWNTENACEGYIPLNRKSYKVHCYQNQAKRISKHGLYCSGKYSTRITKGTACFDKPCTFQASSGEFSCSRAVMKSSTIGLCNLFSNLQI